MSENENIEVIPFFFVADASYSMSGDRIAAVNQLLPQVKEALQEHPAVADRIRFSLISFSDKAQVELPLSDLLTIPNESLPTIVVRGGTNYTVALQELKLQIQKSFDIIKADGFKFKRPLALFLSDGEPLESEAQWKAAFDDLTDPSFRQYPNLIPIGIGECNRDVIRALRHRKDGPAKVPALFDKDGSDIGEVVKELIVALTKSVIASAAAVEEGVQVEGGHAGAFINELKESTAVQNGFDWDDEID
jgi:uncharacterized protein YegL